MREQRSLWSVKNESEYRLTQESYTAASFPPTVFRSQKQLDFNEAANNSKSQQGGGLKRVKLN